MSLHQILHSCRRCGLFGGGAGFGVVSADRNFPYNNAFGESLCAYRAPELGDGVEMTERIISCLPVSYAYRCAKNEYAITRSACLGRNPFGDGPDHISHSVLFGDGDTDAYPCDLIGSPMFFTQPPKQMVDTDTGTAYLPEPAIVPAGGVSVNRVMKFLSSQGNFNVFKNMFTALLRKDELGKKIVICDEQENIVLWIAALNYALPRSFAKKISFSTYAYDPEAENVDICGVTAKGTAYGEAYAVNDKFIVFDIFDGVIWTPSELTAAEEVLFAFLEDAFMHDYEKIRAFHYYLDNYTDLEKAAPDIAGAYLMYCASGAYSAEAFKNVSAEQFDLISGFSGKYGRYSGKLLLSESILRVSETVLGKGADYVEKLLVFIAGVYKDASLVIKNGFRALAFDSVPIMLYNKEATSASFSAYYKSVAGLTDFCGIDICKELVSNKKSRSALLLVIRCQHIEWKANFVLNLISEYVHKQNVGFENLTSGEPLGGFLADAAAERYACGSDGEASAAILSAYTDDVKRFCTVEETLESINTGADKAARLVNLNKAFSEIAANELVEKRSELFDFLSEAEKYDLMWDVFSKMLNTFDMKKITPLFSEHYSGYFAVCPTYYEAYMCEAIETYYAIFKKKKPAEIGEAEQLLFDILTVNDLTTASSDEIVSGIVSGIKLSDHGKDTEAKIREAEKYVSEVQGKQIGGKLLCLSFGLTVKAIKNRKDYAAKREELAAITADERVNLTQFADDEAIPYLEWLLPVFTENADPDEIQTVYDMFSLSTAQSVKFTEEFCRELLSTGKNESDYTEFCKFLRFVFVRLGLEETQEVSYQVHKLNQKRLDRLKEDAKTAFADDYTLMEKFNNMIESTPKRRSIFDIFKK